MSEVRDNAIENRYELVEDGHTAFAAYELGDHNIAFTHTIVPPAIEGRGIGSRLVKTALADARDRGLKVVAHCAFVAGYIDRHPEYRELLA